MAPIPTQPGPNAFGYNGGTYTQSPGTTTKTGTTAKSDFAGNGGNGGADPLPTPIKR